MDLSTDATAGQMNDSLKSFKLAVVLSLSHFTTNRLLLLSTKMMLLKTGRRSAGQTMG